MATIKNLYCNQLPVGVNVLYTAPGPAVILGADFVNTDAANRIVTFFLKVGANTTSLIPVNLTMATGKHYPRTGKITMAVGDQLLGGADAGGVVDCTIHGVEI